MNTLSEEQTDFITEAQNFDEIARCTTGFILYENRYKYLKVIFIITG